MSSIGQSPLISIIIPVYNVEKYLEECLDSVVSQTYRDIEIICIDDGSTDSSPAILAAYAEREKRIKTIRKENGGLSSARNAGLEASKGDYIYYLDSDDSIREDAMETCVRFAETNSLDVLLFDALSYYESDEVKILRPEYENFYIRKEHYDGVMNGPELFCQMIESGEYRTSVCIQFARKSFLLNNNLSFIDGLLFEDNVYSFKLMLLADRVMHIQENLFIRRVRADSITTSYVTAREIYNLYMTLKYMMNASYYESLSPEIMSYIELHLRNHQFYIATKVNEAAEEERKKAKGIIDSNDLPEYSLLIESIAFNLSEKNETEAKLAEIESFLYDVEHSGSYKLAGKLSAVRAMLKKPK